MRCPKCGKAHTRVVDSRMQESNNTIKRDIDTKKLNEIIDDIEVELRSRTLTAVTSHELGDMVLKRLAKIDKVAYIRFASVYRDFKDVDEFLQELDKLR